MKWKHTCRQKHSANLRSFEILSGIHMRNQDAVRTPHSWKPSSSRIDDVVRSWPGMSTLPRFWSTVKCAVAHHFATKQKHKRRKTTRPSRVKASTMPMTDLGRDASLGAVKKQKKTVFNHEVRFSWCHTSTFFFFRFVATVARADDHAEPIGNCVMGLIDLTQSVGDVTCWV